MSGNIPVHTLPKSQGAIPSLKIYRFKNSAGIQQGALLPSTPMPTDMPHRHNYYEVLFIEEGRGFHEIDFYSYPIIEAGIHFITPGQVHLLNFATPCKGFIIAFSEQYYSFYNPTSTHLSKFTFFQTQQKRPILTLNEQEKQYFHNLVENMTTEHLLSESDQSMIGRYLGLLLQKSENTFHIREHESNAIQATPELIGRFQELVEKNFLKWHEVQQYAQALSVSPDYLSKQVKKFLDASCQEYILEKLLLEAKRLLVFTQLNAKEIAYHIHIEDPSYFSRIFKKKTGLTPNEYRDLVRKSTI